MRTLYAFVKYVCKTVKNSRFRAVYPRDLLNARSYVAQLLGEILEHAEKLRYLLMNEIVGIFIGRRTRYHKNLHIIAVRLENNIIELAHIFADLAGNAFKREKVLARVKITETHSLL